MVAPSLLDEGELALVQARDLVARAGERGLLALRADGEAFGEDELDLAQAEEREELAYIFCMRVPPSILAAARDHHVSLLAGEQAHRALLGVLERHASARDVVEISLERRGQREVVHRQADHEAVRRLQLADQAIRVI